MTRTRVLVIGAGPYGIAVAHELWARGLDVVVVGEPFELWRRHTLSSMVLRSGGSAAAGELGLRETASGVFSGATGSTFDYVVAATGFRFSLRNLPFLSETLRSALGESDRPPDLNDRFESTVENLYMVGGIAESTFGPAMRFIFGSRPAARHLGRQLTKSL